jgi:transposase
MSSIIAFDVSKKELIGVRMRTSGTVAERYTVTNTLTAINTFLDTLPPGVRFIGSEATGPYHTFLASACVARSTPFKLLNPLVTKQFTRATIRKRKTDEDDAVYIGRSLLLDEGRALTQSDLSPALPHLRTATHLVNMAASIKRRRNRFATYVPDSLAAQQHLADAEHALRAAAKALRTIGTSHVPEKERTLLTSIPGIGKTLAATIVSEVRDITRFGSGKSLVAYAGLDPRVRQSGTSLVRNTHITKRGSSHLRHALFLAAAIGQRHDPELQAYYAKKRTEGSCFTETTVANARHVAHRVCAVLKRGTPYVTRVVQSEKSTALD